MMDVFDESTYLGAFNERQKKMSWAIGSFMEAGVTVVFGTDCPIVSIDPFLGLYRAVTRLHDDGKPEGGYNPEQRISIEDALDCIEDSVKKYGQTGARHAIEHFETTIPEDITRCASLGVIASIQPAHIAMMDVFDESTYLGAFNKRQKKMSWAIRSFMDAGVIVAFGSDCPIVSNDPFLALYRAVTRLHNDGKPEGGWNPEQRISMEDALEAYTLNGAYGVGREDELGTLEKGKLADFIVLDRNLLKIDAEEIRGTKVLKTFMDGKCVYAAVSPVSDTKSIYPLI
jgi:predicted amidohydrolase YtcJ